ncbi:hypothetical protein NDU88_004339 [Pleurodeles waltl]|uniref:Uncharacterized protein n=1 Tax=Pleurodeles waltl TaxID=8319 RepID=A0AAV7V372_PLEWA|nr:hypothetical protein NDU88_004339 [Pleurodeles waltl]
MNTRLYQAAESGLQKIDLTPQITGQAEGASHVPRRSPQSWRAPRHLRAISGAPGDAPAVVWLTRGVSGPRGDGQQPRLRQRAPTQPSCQMSEHVPPPSPAPRGVQMFYVKGALLGPVVPPLERKNAEWIQCFSPPDMRQHVVSSPSPGLGSTQQHFCLVGFWSPHFQGVKVDYKSQNADRFVLTVCLTQ